MLLELSDKNRLKLACECQHIHSHSITSESILTYVQFPNWHSRRCLCAIKLQFSLNGSNNACVLVDPHVIHSCLLWQNGKFSLMGLHERCKIQENLHNFCIYQMRQMTGSFTNLTARNQSSCSLFFFHPSNWASGHDVFLISTHYLL